MYCGDFNFIQYNLRLIPSVFGTSQVTSFTHLLTDKLLLDPPRPLSVLNDTMVEERMVNALRQFGRSIRLVC